MEQGIHPLVEAFDDPDVIASAGVVGQGLLQPVEQARKRAHRCLRRMVEHREPGIDHVSYRISSHVGGEAIDRQPPASFEHPHVGGVHPHRDGELGTGFENRFHEPLSQAPSSHFRVHHGIVIDEPVHIFSGYAEPKRHNPFVGRNSALDLQDEVVVMGRGERVSLHQPPECVHSPGGERRPSLRIPEPLECAQVVMPVSPDAKIEAAGARIEKTGHVHCRLSMNAGP
ncbi:MAG: hypothetical protein BWZ01_03217 [Deltaproteobacteria bacterium ADurb.BinA179]|nr:MAG: hypothetical protein BWZ01_03217 [Deltaproteobacteria bacterium ADurb.BinA179]